MKIARVHIENYRSIKQLDFSPNNYCALIGENNAGKSNILKAINLVLGETWPTDRTFTEEDFNDYNTENDIVIQIYFDSTIDEWRNNCKCEIAGFELRGKAYKRRVKSKPAGTLVVDFVCIDKKGRPCQYPATPYKEGERYTGQYYQLKVSKELRERVPFIYVDVMRDYNKQDPSNRWSILRRLFNDINTSLSSDKTTVNVETSAGKKKMTRKQAFELKIKEAYSFLQTEQFIEIESKIRTNSLEQMGIDSAEGDIAIRFDTYDSMNVFKNLQLYVDQMGISTTADMVGAGLQSAIVIAIFRTYEEIKKEGAIFAIEEPEVYLHPQKQRYFSTILSRLSGQNQVFITTHSPTFIRLYEPENVCLIRRNNADGTTAKLCEREQIVKTEKEALKLENYFDNQRNEMFFAKGVIFVEGATEKFAFPYAGRKMDVDIDRYGISVVECGGKGNLLTFAKVATAFGIPYVVVADEDIKDLAAIKDPEKKKKAEAENANHTKKNTALKDFVPAAQKTTYRVKINEDELVRRSVDGLRNMEAIPKARIITQTADIQIDNPGVTYIERGIKTAALEDSYSSLPNILAIIGGQTLTKRATVAEILKQSGRLQDFLNNPQMFIENATQIILDVRRTLAIDGISYKKLYGEEYYVQEIFDSAELIANLDRNAVAVDHSVYDYIVYDSTTVEKPFALALDNDPDVKMFFKLPSRFKVDTPIGTYNPDWAVYVEIDGSKKLYFILETKGKTNELDLRGREDLKIRCGKAHFKAIGSSAELYVATKWNDFKVRNI